MADAHYDQNDFFDMFSYENPGSAAIAVGVMVAASAVFLAILKKSGFRAMIAVGR